MNAIRRHFSTIVLIAIASCSSAQHEKISNKDGGYSLMLSEGWMLYRMDRGNTLLVSREKMNIESSVYFGFIQARYPTLEQSFTDAVAQLAPGFRQYKNQGIGSTTINGQPAMWHRMQYMENGESNTTIIYSLKPPGDSLLVVSCSAKTNQLHLYEEDMKNMVASVELLTNNAK